MPKSKVRKKAKQAATRQRAERARQRRSEKELFLQDTMSTLAQYRDYLPSECVIALDELDDLNEVLADRPGWCFDGFNADHVCHWHFHDSDGHIPFGVFGDGVGIRSRLLVVLDGIDLHRGGVRIPEFDDVEDFIAALDEVEAYRAGSPTPKGSFLRAY